MKIKQKVLKKLQKIFSYNVYCDDDIDETISLTLAEVEKTHVTNKFMIEKLKEQKKVDMLEVGKVIDKIEKSKLRDRTDTFNQIRKELGIKQDAKGRKRE